MATTMTPAYITTIRPDRTIVLPDEMAVGTTVAVVILPSLSETDDTARKERFEATLNAIDNVPYAENAPSISNEQLDTLIKRAITSSRFPKPSHSRSGNY